eukprot:6993228-Alexandrium_andersonii.AAC.2
MPVAQGAPCRDPRASWHVAQAPRHSGKPVFQQAVRGAGNVVFAVKARAVMGGGCIPEPGREAGLG